MVTHYFALLKDYQKKDILMNLDADTIKALIGLPNKISTQVFNMFVHCDLEDFP